MSIPPDFPADLRGAEEHRQRAMLAADTEALAAVLHDDLIYIHSNGVFDTKTSHLAGIAKGVVKYTELAIGNATYIRLGADAWLVSGRLQAAAAVAAQTIPIDAAFTSTWLRRASWQMVSWQSTPWPRLA